MKALAADVRAVDFVLEAYKHCKAVGATSEATLLLQTAGISSNGSVPNEKGKRSNEPPGIVIGNGNDSETVAGFVKAVAQHRFWEGEPKE